MLSPKSVTPPAAPTHPWEVTVGGTPHRAATLPTQLSEDLGPIDPPPHHDSVQGDNTDPQNDSGKNAPVSPNPAPPAAPFPAKVAPKSSQPPGGAPEGGGDDSDKPIPPDPEDPTGPGTSDEGQEEYVGGHLTTEWVEAAATSKCPICGGPPVSSCRCVGPHTMEMLAAGHGKTCAKKHRWSGRIAYCMASGTGTVVGEPRLDPKPLPNPDGGGLDPNPDNATYIPGRTSEDADSFDQGKKPNLDDCVWLLGKKGVSIKVDRQTGLARWPIETSQVQRDFNPPNKTVDRNVEPNAPRGQDSEYIGDTDKPYQTGSPPI